MFSRFASINNRGFTLLEAMIALLILATALMGILEARNRVLKGAALAGGLLQAVQLAEQKLAEFDVSGYPAETIHGQFEEYPGYEWQARVLPINMGILSGARRVDLLVRFPTLGKKPEILTITTCYAPGN